MVLVIIISIIIIIIIVIIIMIKQIIIPKAEGELLRGTTSTASSSGLSLTGLSLEDEADGRRAIIYYNTL